MFKKLKSKLEKEKRKKIKRKTTELEKPNVVVEVYNNNEKCD